jgi:uncharacterized protein (DUF952 family)
VKPTFHLVPAAEWSSLSADAPYAPPTLGREGFIHCTSGADELVETANRYYVADPRPFLVVTVDLDSLDVQWRHDDPGSPYPHVYGPIARDAILAVNPIGRADDGRFLPFDP